MLRDILCPYCNATVTITSKKSKPISEIRSQVAREIFKKIENPERLLKHSDQYKNWDVYVVPVTELESLKKEYGIEE